MASAAARASWLFASLRDFKPSWLPGDAMAAMTLAAIAIPEQLATAHRVRGDAIEIAHIRHTSRRPWVEER